MRWIVCAVLLLGLAACGGGNNSSSTSSGCSGGSRNSSDSVATTPEGVRDAFMKARAKLDLDGMKPYLSAEDYEKTAKDFGKATDEVEALDYEQVDWREENGYWVFEFKQTARMKDGKTDVDPKRSIYVVKESDKWIVKTSKPK